MAITKRSKKRENNYCRLINTKEKRKIIRKKELITYCSTLIRARSRKAKCLCTTDFKKNVKQKYMHINNIVRRIFLKQIQITVSLTIPSVYVRKVILT